MKKMTQIETITWEDIQKIKEKTGYTYTTICAILTEANSIIKEVSLK